MSSLRFTPQAQTALRAAITDAGGIEVFAVGSINDKREVHSIEVHARGTDDAVLALRSRPRAGQVVIHNHPSGVLRPSAPDMELASQFGEEGVGFIIVDNLVQRALWVVEPAQKPVVAVEASAVAAIFTQQLPTIFPGWEPRPGQIEMAQRVVETLNGGGVRMLEAGTGTGKSLAYLVPAAMWALANDAKVVVSTYTRTLQGQLLKDDLPVLTRIFPVRAAVMKGRNNYVCRRKLDMAGDDPTMEAIRRWSKTTRSGEWEDLGLELDEETWERVESDSDQTLRARCPHFNTCFYYEARRRAAAAHVVVVNHALLLSDLMVKEQNQGVGILPAFDRIVFDEAHHIEEAATRVAEERFSSRGVARAVGPLLPRRRQGALLRIVERWPTLREKVEPTARTVDAVRDRVDLYFAGLEPLANASRVRAEAPQGGLLQTVVEDLEKAGAALGAIEAALEGEEIKVEDAQPVLDVRRARRKLETSAASAKAFQKEDLAFCRYLDPGKRGIAAARAPIDVGPTLKRILQEKMKAVILTSATLAVNGDVGHFQGRVGLDAADFFMLPSPFHYREQAILALPRDLPPPDAPDYDEHAARVIAAAIEASRGGAFVLCTSHAAVQALSQRVEATLGNRYAILRQGRGSRGQLLSHFREDRGSVLFGTDSFWEGVSVKGEALRLVIIPRLPFRVPTEPVAEARYERLKAEGKDPFRAWALPEAVIKLRQGFGRLIRSATDRGVVMILDRRIHDRWYGQIFLRSLPDARRVVGPTQRVLQELRGVYSQSS